MAGSEARQPHQGLLPHVGEGDEGAAIPGYLIQEIFLETGFQILHTVGGN